MIFPVRFRRRLTVAFVLVAAISAGALAAASFLLVRHHRLQANVDRAVEISRFNLTFAPRDAGTERIEELLAYYERWAGVEAVVRTGRGDYSSRDTFDVEDVPISLRESVRVGKLSHTRTRVDGVPYLVTGSQIEGAETELFFFFSMEELFEGLEVLRNVLVIGCVALTALAAGIGHAIARRTLAPVRSAAAAARQLAEGLLETRLEVVTHDEFGAWARYFNDMAQALEEKIAALEAAHARERRFTADVAHELRTPLSTLVGSASMLAAHIDDVPPDLRRPAEMTISGIARLRRLVEDLMELSRLDARSEPLIFDRINIGEAVPAMVRANGWESDVQLRCSEVLVDVDRRSFDRVIGNLVGNAIQHGGRDVWIRVDRDGEDALVEVSDRGPGIPPEHLPRIFNRFHKVDGSRSEIGSGLGLAIAYENAQRLGARLDVRSTLGAGTTFMVRLPAAAAESEHRDKEQSGPEPPVQASPTVS